MELHLYFINIILLFITAYLTEHKAVSFCLGNRKFSERKYDHIFFCLFWVILLAVEFGLGGSQSSDYDNYKTWFTIAHNWSLSDVYKHTREQGFYFLNYVGSHIFNRYSVFRIFYGVIISVCYFKVYRKESDSIWVPLMVFLCTGLFYGGLNLSSQLLAAAVYATSVPYIYRRRIIPYIIIVFLASSFHISALFLLPLYFMPCIRSINNSMKMVIVAGALMAVLVLRPYITVIAGRLSRYFYGLMYVNTDISGITLQYLLKNLVMVGFIILCSHCFDMKDLKQKTIYLGSILYGVVAAFAFQFSMFQRYMYYLIIFVMLAFGVIAKSKMKKHIVAMVFMFLLMQINQVRDTFFLLY